MIWLLNSASYEFFSSEDLIKFIENLGGCTILKTSSPLPQWVQCDDADLIILKIRFPKLVTHSFTEEEFQKELDCIEMTDRHRYLTKMDCLALSLRLGKKVDV